MINSIPILTNALSTLKETSKSNHSGTVEYMTTSTLPAIDFDNVKNNYIKPLSVPETPKSSDALYIKGEDEMYLIEFKSGEMDTKKIYDVRLKIFDSLLILTDILGIGISHTRQNLNYILVYNLSKNPPKEESDNAQISLSRTSIKKHFLKKGKNRLIEWSLGRFEKLYFKDVYTVTKDEFENEFVNMWQI